MKKLKQVFKKILKELELISIEDKKMRVLAPMPTRDLLGVIEGEDQSIRKVFEKGW